jgi:hypothetical protein
MVKKKKAALELKAQFLSLQEEAEVTNQQKTLQMTSFLLMVLFPK